MLYPFELAGPSILGRSITAILHVSPNGNSEDGLSWETAFTRLQDALDVASTDPSDCTLILISPA